MKEKHIQLLLTVLTVYGCTYIQWGRRHCTEKDAEEVYSGIKYKSVFHHIFCIFVKCIYSIKWCDLVL